jgi:hypothetical protein
MSGIWRGISYNNVGSIENIAYFELIPRGTTAEIKGFIFDESGISTGRFSSEDVLVRDLRIIFLYNRVSSVDVKQDDKVLAMFDFGDEKDLIGKLVDIGNGKVSLVKGVRASVEEKLMYERRDWDSVPSLIEKVNN